MHGGEGLSFGFSETQCFIAKVKSLICVIVYSCYVDSGPLQSQFSAATPDSALVDTNNMVFLFRGSTVTVSQRWAGSGYWFRFQVRSLVLFF